MIMNATNESLRKSSYRRSDTQLSIQTNKRLDTDLNIQITGAVQDKLFYTHVQ